MRAHSFAWGLPLLLSTVSLAFGQQVGRQFCVGAATSRSVVHALSWGGECTAICSHIFGDRGTPVDLGAVAGRVLEDVARQHAELDPQQFAAGRCDRVYPKAATMNRTGIVTLRRFGRRSPEPAGPTPRHPERLRSSPTSRRRARAAGPRTGARAAEGYDPERGLPRDRQRGISRRRGAYPGLL